MNKPGNDSEATIFLIILGVIGVALPAALCGGGLLVFGFANTRTVVAPNVSVSTTFAAPASSQTTLGSSTTRGGSFGVGSSTTLGAPPTVDFPTTQPPINR